MRRSTLDEDEIENVRIKNKIEKLDEVTEINFD